MNKNLKIKSLWLLVIFLGVIGVAGVVGAYNGGNPGVVVENWSGDYLGSDSQAGMLGGGTRFPNGISADSTSPSSGEVRGTTFTSTGDVTVGDDLTVTSDLDVDRVTEGSGVYASTTAAVAAGTLNESDILNYTSMDLTATGDTTHTLTLPATSTMTTLIPNAGDYVMWHFRMIGTAAKASTTITAGTGIDLVENENGDVIIEAGNEAWLRFIRESDTDVTVSVDEYIAAD